MSTNLDKINSVSLGFTTFPVEIGVQRVYYIGWQAAVKKKPKNVVAVMSGSL